jgi:hypothetical protein
MNAHKDIAQFELELQFEAAAENFALSPAQRQQEMQAVLERMFANVMAGYRLSPALGRRLSDITLDYLKREDVGVEVVRKAFNRASGSKVANIYEHLLLSEMRRTVARIENYRPTMPVAAMS